ncbi:DUF1488 domain-containing protein [Martelella sp. AD-3]|uniref:DUF1488 domain-containing protein n=1 Tax=Martelella sp. AD-3 TaxID=686597 RepID=UPI00046420A9|nr:DUF1488 domain-containing protein [Martelella sp. AD-3]AMM86745.1 hypothetical protein AZF01_09355 [Martelella sp. AD-3]|tara:strand:- start:31 stop:285 length:255 start_codon:yes stop_codon:yes gene_type:complete
MALEFPNQSRSYDNNGKRVRFTGHDGMFEVMFFARADALRNPADGEEPYLAAFDAAREKIYDAARRIYLKGRKAVYTLTASDLT